MQITQVHYQKLVSLGNYENERIGAWGTVEEGEEAEEALHKLTTWVQGQIDATHAVRSSLQEAESDLYTKRAELREYEANIANAKARWEKIAKWFRDRGISLPSRWGDDDIPF